MNRKNTGNLALDAGRGGRRKARRAALDNLFQQARKEVEKAKKRGDSPPDAEQMFHRMYADSRFRGLMAAVNLQGDQVIGAFLRAGAIKKGGKDMAEKEVKEAKVKTGTVWETFKRRWQMWLGLIFVGLIMVLAVLVALQQERVIGALLLGYVGGVMSALLYSRRRG